VDSGTESADALAADRSVPKIDTKAPGGIGCPVLSKLAPFNTPPGAITGVCAAAIAAAANNNTTERRIQRF
jgi:hypothetical protein